MNSKTQKQKIGDIGEELASRFLVKQGFRVIERNYRKTFGEIDIKCFATYEIKIRTEYK